MRRWLPAGVVLALVGAMSVALPARADVPCPHLQAGVHPYTIDGDTGFVGEPDHGQPTTLVVFFHGYGHDACDWAQNHLGDVARDDHVLTVAMDYPRWRVQEGADASVAAVHDLRAQHPSITTVIAYGVSMGGNASGLALADTKGVFQWWWDVEGATNVIETYNEARAVALSGNAFAKAAQADIEDEMGGPIEQHPDRYQHGDVLARTSDVVASGVQGVVMCHGVGDGLVPYDQSREMAAALRANDKLVDFTSFVTRTSGSEPGTVLDGYLPVPHDSPFAGHADEDSHTQDVGNCGFERLHDFLVKGIAPVDRDVVRDGMTGVTTG